MIHENKAAREAISYVEGFLASCQCRTNDDKRRALVAILRAATDEISRLRDFSQAENTATSEIDGLIRMPDVERLTGLARPTIYKRINDDPTFPKPVKLSASTGRGAPVGWRLTEVKEWIASRKMR
jgi:prophage regulatory protein